MAVARPRAGFRAARVEAVTADAVILKSVALASKLLVHHLRGRRLAFPYLATEGPELAAWGEARPPEERNQAHTIRYAVAKLAENEVETAVMRHFGLNQVSAMNPGSLDLWPLGQQEPLFRLLAPLPGHLGVIHRPDHLMWPELTTSGLYFPTEAKFYNCQLCPREHCPVRRVPYRGAEEAARFMAEAALFPPP